MSLVARIGVTAGSFELEVELAASEGELVALLGPNGSGKTTALRALAGLVALDRGRIELGGTVIDDASTGVFVSPEHRRVGVVFQDYALFATMIALDNVAFGLRARGVRRGEARRRAGELLERLGVAAHADRTPRELSGGQAQRVALARALAIDPAMLLLDEPLAALDVATRAEVRRDLRAQLDGCAGVRILVTHDPVDAYVLADRVVVLEAGRVVQSGALADLAAHPRSAYVAELVGVNLLRGRVEAGRLALDTGVSLVVADDGARGATLATVHPRAVSLHRARPEGSPRNVWTTTVAGIDRIGDRARVALGDPIPLTAEITMGSLVDLGLAPGDAVWVSVKATEVSTYPA